MKPVLRLAVDESATQIKNLACAIGRSESYTSDVLNEGRTQELTVRDLVAFIRATNLTPLRWLCREFDGTFVPLPALMPGHQDIRDRFLVAIEEVGKDSSLITRALSDGQITDDEGRVLIDELENTIAVFREVISLVHARRPRPVRMGLSPQAPAAAKVGA